MGRRWTGAVGVLLLSLLWSTGEAESTWWLLNARKTPGTISGQVRVACQPPKGVLVYLSGRSFIAFTDADGQFILDWVPPGTYLLHVETVDPPAVHEETVKVASGRDTRVGPIELSPDFQTDPQHCGACGQACAAGEPCTAGVCGTGACAAGTGNCDGDPANGCETDLTKSTQHCGACGTGCTNSHGTTACVAGACKPACSAGFGDCDANVTNGCETDLSSSVQHCGACGAGCTNGHGTTACVAGACQPTCIPGFGNCDGNAANGCETSLTTDGNCGGCGIACSPPFTCQGGRCAPLACPPGFGNCDLNPANGCETSLTTNANCGACGIACGPGLSCQSGSCQ